MKKLCIISLVLLLLSLPSFSIERIPIWGDFNFDMKRKQAINVLKKKCKKIDYETKIQAVIKASGCKFLYEPFHDLETSIELIFDFALLKNNRRLKYIVFNFEDLNRDYLKKLYKYSKDNWYVLSDWSCNPPSRYSVVAQTIQLCGAVFKDGKVRLTNTVSAYDEYSKESSSTSRITRMYFHAVISKSSITGNP